MKRKTILITLALLLIFYSLVWAAGSVSYTLSPIDKDTRNMWKLVFNCTGDATNGSIPDTTVSDIFSLYGMYAYRLIIEDAAGGTSVTADSDVYLYATVGSTAKGYDILGDEGVDALDADTVNNIRLSYKDPIWGPLVLDVDNQSTASAIYTIIIIFGK